MFLRKLQPFQNVGAGLTAIMPTIPLGMTYMGIILKRGGTFTNAHLDNIRLTLDGKRIWDITGAHLLAQNQYMNFHALDFLLSHTHTENTAGTYTQNATTGAPDTYTSSYDLIWFGDFQARTIGGETLGGIDTSIGYNNFQMEIDVNGSASSPTLEAWAILAPPKAAGDPNKATIRAILKRIESPSAAGEFDFQVPLGSRSGALIHKTFMHHSNVTKLQVLKDGLPLLQEGETALVAFMQGIKNRNPQTGLMVYDPTTNDNQSDTVSTLRRDGKSAAFEFKTTVSGSDTVTIYSSLYATLDRV